MLLKKLFKIDDPAYFRGLAHAGSIGLHLVSGVVVGTVLGYFLDAWLGTDPWLLLVFMIFGIVAGFRNVYIDTRRLAASEKEQPSAPGEKTDTTTDMNKPDVRTPSSKNGNGPA